MQAGRPVRGHCSCPHGRWGGGLDLESDSGDGRNGTDPRDFLGSTVIWEDLDFPTIFIESDTNFEGPEVY